MKFIIRIIEKKKGAISLFMAIIMLSSLVLTSILVDGSRLRSAETIVQSASDSALRSVLAKYDIDLKDRYGLFTIENQQDVTDDYLQFFMANISSNLPAQQQNSFQKYFNTVIDEIK